MGDVIQFDRSEGSRIRGHTPANDFFAPGGFLAAVNAVHITGAHLKRAIETIRHIVVKSPSDIAEHGRLLEHFAREHGLGDHGGAALHARGVALDRWAQEFDPFGESDQRLLRRRRQRPACRNRDRSRIRSGELCGTSPKMDQDFRLKRER
jgi:hypothetical protein